MEHSRRSNIADSRSALGAGSPLPPQLFAIPMGLAGLANTWRTATARVAAPTLFANAIYGAAALVAALLVAVLLPQIARNPRRALAALADPVAAPFCVLLPLTGMLLALGLDAYAHTAAAICFGVCLGATWLFAAWLAGEWLLGRTALEAIHPGYFLPGVATGMIGADGLAQLGSPTLGTLSFGAGALCWALFGAVIFYRLMAGPPLPERLTATLAILLAPPSLAASAHFALNGNQPDTLAYALAGIVALMALVQLRFLPLYRALPFSPAFWAFTFPCAAFVSCLHRWLAALKAPAGPIIAWALLMLLSGLVGWIAWKTLALAWAARE